MNTFNPGMINIVDPPIKPHLISVIVSKEKFEQDMLPALKNGGDPFDSKNYVANVPIKVWNGGHYKNKETGEIDKSKVTYDTINLPINLAKMSNAFVNLTDEKPVTTDSLNPDMAPVRIIKNVEGLYYDEPATRSYRIDIDPAVTAVQSAMQRREASMLFWDRGLISKPMSEKQCENLKQRFEIDMRLNTSYHSVAGISVEAIEANVGKIATQNYIFNPYFAGKDEADPVTKIKDTVTKVAGDYAKFIKDNFEAAIASKNGLPNLKSVSIDPSKNGTEIEGTAIDAFPGKIKVVRDGDCTRYVIKADPETKTMVNDWFKDFNSRLGKQWGQEVFGKYEDKSIENKLAKAIKPQMYTVNPQGSYAIVVQPGMIANFTPYVNSFVKAYDAATHGRDIPGVKEIGIGKSVEDIYEGRTDFIKNAETLFTTYDDMKNSLKQADHSDILKCLEEQFPNDDKQMGD